MGYNSYIYVTGNYYFIRSNIKNMSFKLLIILINLLYKNFLLLLIYN